MHGNQAYYLGRADRRDGRSLACCPFDADTYQAREWLRGWWEVDASGACAIVGVDVVKVTPVTPPAPANDDQPARPRPLFYPPARPWEQADDVILSAMWRDGRDISDICTALDRTKSSITGRAFRIGLPSRAEWIKGGEMIPRESRMQPPAISKRPWSRLDERRLRRMYTAPGADVSRIAIRLGRTERAIRSKAHELNLRRRFAGDVGKVAA